MPWIGLWPTLQGCRQLLMEPANYRGKMEIQSSLISLTSPWACMYRQPSNSIAPIYLYITNPISVSHFAKTWVSLQTKTYISKSTGTKYFDKLLLLTCEEFLHAPIDSPNLSSKSKFHHLLNPKQPSNSPPFLHYELVTGNFLSKMVVIFPYPVVTQAHSRIGQDLLLSLEKWNNSNSFQTYSYSKLITILSNKRMLHSVTNYSLYINKTMVEKLSHIFIHPCFMKRDFDNLHSGHQWFSHVA